ncbi:MAG: sadH [Candidatus Saccharibacteria bacterium]|nr:sadH [Candidatus Saccharibacteria bacterium]
MSQRSSKVVVITGASSGIGKAVALSLAKQKYSLVIASRNSEKLQSVAKECQKAGAQILAITTDVSGQEAVEHLLQASVRRFGKVDIWINNASVIFYGRFLDIRPEEFRQVIETNLFGVVNGSRAALKHFKETSEGTLINISSGFGAVPAPFVSSYVTSKFAVRGLTASLMQELYVDGQKGIHVCSVLPATIRTPVYEHSGNRMQQSARAVPPTYSAEFAARKIIRLIDHPKSETVIGRPIRAMTIFYAMAPALALRLFARYVRRFNYRRQPNAPNTGNVFAPTNDERTTAKSKVLHN